MKDIKDNKDFNKRFEKTEKTVLVDDKIDNEYSNKHYPHKDSLEKIIINIRELFFIVLEMLIDKKNPLPFIFASESRKFSFAVFLLLFGSLLLLLSTLMKSA